MKLELVIVVIFLISGCACTDAKIQQKKEVEIVSEHKKNRLPDVSTMAGSTKVGDEEFVIDRIEKRLPKGWSVELKKDDGACSLVIRTVPMKYRPSLYYSGDPHERGSKPIEIIIKVLPRYSEKFTQSIRNYNRQFNQRIPGAHSKTESRKARTKMIDVPRFYDSRYGYLAKSPTNVPFDEDLETIILFLKNITDNWRTYGDNISAAKALENTWREKIRIRRTKK